MWRAKHSGLVPTPELSVWLIFLKGNDSKIVLVHDGEALGRNALEEILCCLFTQTRKRFDEDDVLVRRRAFGVYPLPS